jgi:hypothetical protein
LAPPQFLRPERRREATDVLPSSFPPYFTRSPRLTGVYLVIIDRR